MNHGSRRGDFPIHKTVGHEHDGCFLLNQESAGQGFLLSLAQAFHEALDPGSTEIVLALDLPLEAFEMSSEDIGVIASFQVGLEARLDAGCISRGDESKIFFSQLGNEIVGRLLRHGEGKFKAFAGAELKDLFRHFVFEGLRVAGPGENSFQK